MFVKKQKPTAWEHRNRMKGLTTVMVALWPYDLCLPLGPRSDFPDAVHRSLASHSTSRSCRAGMQKQTRPSDRRNPLLASCVPAEGFPFQNTGRRVSVAFLARQSTVDQTGLTSILLGLTSILLGLHLLILRRVNGSGSKSDSR